VIQQEVSVCNVYLYKPDFLKIKKCIKTIFTKSLSLTPINVQALL